MDSGVQSESVLASFQHLAELMLGPPKRAYVHPSAPSYDDKCTVLKRKLYNTLFDNLLVPLSGGRSKPAWQGVRKEVDGVLTFAFHLRCQRRFEEASRLEGCLDVLLSKFGSNMEADVWQVLLLLVKLTNTGPTPPAATLGHRPLPLPLLGSQETSVLLPPGPPCYGDCRRPDPACFMYMHYPSEIFKVSFDESNLNNMDDGRTLSVFRKSPGAGLLGDFFSAKGLGERAVEYSGSSSLLSLLSHSPSLDIALEFPELPDHRPPEIRIPRDLSSSQLSVDEGYTRSDMSSSPPLSSHSLATLQDSGLEDSIWEQALTQPHYGRYTWECIGRGVTEKCYLTELGSEAVDRIVVILQHATSMVDVAALPPTPLRPLFPEQLIPHVLNLLIGVPSTAFNLNQEEQRFEQKEGLCVKGLSPEALADLLVDFLECGSLYHRLALFSRPPCLDSFYRRGLVFQAFTCVLRRLLQHYSGAIIAMPLSSSLLQLQARLAPVCSQMRFLARLCWCGLDEGNAADIPAQEFPLGTELLSYLYSETLEAACTAHYPMMLSVLQTSCGPFTAFLQDWVFHGIYRDVYSEFMIQLNPEFLQSRDRDYWTRGFELKSGDNLPLFIETLANPIFVCGKTVNLLRAICPGHFMCNVKEYEVPRISITYLTSDLHSIEVQCQTFLEQMKQRAKMLTISRAEKKAAEEEAKRELLRRANEVATEELRRFQEAERARRQKVTEKKQKEFKRLKEQMEADLQRRAMEREEARAEDQAYIAMVTQAEEEQEDRDQELEKQAREELVRFYSELSAEAARREQRALWRVQRARLDTARQQLLAAQTQQWQQELQDRAAAQTVLAASEGPSLPVWVGQGDKAWTEEEEQTSRPRATWAPQPLELQPKEGEPETEVVTESDKQVGLEVSRARWASPREQEGSGDQGKTLPKWVQQLPQPPPVPTGDELNQVSQSQELNRGPDSASDLTPQPTVSEGYAGNDDQRPKEIVVGGRDSVESPGGQKGDGTGGKSSEESGQIPPPDSVSCTDVTVTVGDDTQIRESRPAEDPESSETSPREEQSTPRSEESKVSLSKISFDSVTTPRDLNVSSASTDLITALAERHQRMKRHLKTTIRLSDSASATQQSEEIQYKPHIQTIQGRHATSETTPDEETVPHIKFVPERHATKQTEADESHVPTIKFIEGRSAVKQSEEEAEARPHLKTVEGRGATQESAPGEDHSIPHLRRPEGQSVSQETEAQEWCIKKPSAFGHASQLSNSEYVLAAPRLKRREEIYANLQSESRDYAIRPRIRMHPSRSASAQSEPAPQPRPHIRSSTTMSATTESQFVDMDAVRLQKFRQRNVHGHSSDSTVQRLLYGDGALAQKQLEELPEEEGPETSTTPASPADVWDLDGVQQYSDNYDFLNDFPAVDLMARLPVGAIGSMGDYCVSLGEDVEMVEYLPLPALIHKSMTAPLTTQISLINDAIVNHFLVELKMEEHFEALRRYIFMADGDFAQILTDIILDKLSSRPLPQELLNPLFLNSTLTRALQSSVQPDDPYAQNLSFALKFFPAVFHHNAHDTLDCLELKYKVGWPLNIVVTEDCQARYAQVFSFMLQLRRVVWSLSDVWHRLKRDAVVRKVGNSVHMRKVQLYRQEMQHFVRVMQGYMAHQVVDVSWCEFRETLGSVRDLDDLHDVHSKYLHKVIFRCLLNKKAAPVMKVVQDIFCHILKFHALLEGATWSFDEETGEATHPAFPKLEATYSAFREYSFFLFRVVTKLAQRGYQPHLQELVLRLNFNGYYSR